ncbi:hypothetical protein EDD22DRAFT_955368 [Suillus occidentalis]|nr:hypothetical protein EDD22DRAFT_955368 [Suillus occidentalis]
MFITRRARNLLILDRSFGAAFARGYATVTELPRPPPPTGEPHVETFSAPSKPRLYYARPPLKADLPRVQKRWPFILAFATLGVSAWAAFLLFATNQEKLSSSVVQRIMQTINLPQGNVDLSFRLKGHQGSGTLYFTSIRKAKGQPFTPLRFRVIGDDKRVVNLYSQTSESSSAVNAERS